MKKTVFLISTLIFSIYLSGCARMNVNDNVANRNQNLNDPTRVNYTPNPTGPTITDVDNRNNVTNVRTDNRNLNQIDNRSKMRVADDAAKNVADLPEVDTANVIVTENNAYVAAKLSRGYGDNLTNSIKNKISNRVKSVDRDIDNVYVSVNPDFYGQMNTWANDIRKGQPVSGFVNQFNDAVRRVFPNQK
jgi:YhcN/YlaJ family sporulation lipoprotein